MTCTLEVVLKSLDERIAKAKKSIEGLEDEVKGLKKETNECRRVLKDLKNLKKEIR